VGQDAAPIAEAVRRRACNRCEKIEPGGGPCSPEHAAMSAKWQSRTRLWVASAFQGETLLRVAVYWLCYHVVIWQLMFLWELWSYLGSVSDGTTPRTFGEIYADFFSRHYPLLVAAGVVLPLLLWDALRMTNRVVGPLARFRNCLNRMARGEPVAPIAIRRGDFLVDLKDAINAVVQSPYRPRNEGSANSVVGLSDSVLDDFAASQANLWRTEAPAGRRQIAVRVGSPAT
jgi:hypothetical protein